MELKFEVYAGPKGEKKNSRRYGVVAEEPGVAPPISDIYVKRPFAEGKDKLTITISE